MRSAISQYPGDGITIPSKASAITNNVQIKDYNKKNLMNTGADGAREERTGWHRLRHTGKVAITGDRPPEGVSEG
jgi:hypothetical protein